MTLGDKGCIAKRSGEQEIVQEPACSGVTVTDATGVGETPDHAVTHVLYQMLCQTQAVGTQDDMFLCILLSVKIVSHCALPVLAFLYDITVFIHYIIVMMLLLNHCRS